MRWGLDLVESTNDITDQQVLLDRWRCASPARVQALAGSRQTYSFLSSIRTASPCVRVSLKPALLPWPAAHLPAGAD